MIAYCWADGLIELGRKAPSGSVELARGNRTRLGAVVLSVAEWAVRNNKAVRVVPGVSLQQDMQTRKLALSRFLAHVAAGNHRDIRINYPTDDLRLRAERRSTPEG